MKRALIPFAIAVLAGTMVAQTPPPPPAQATPAPQATPAVPAAPATPAPAAKARVRVYRAAPAVASSSSGSYLGVDVRDVTSTRARELKLKNEQGVEITRVDQDGPAGKAGIKENDVVVSFSGQNVQSAEQLRRLI